VEILYQNRRGTFSMKTTVLKQEGELLRLAHSEEVDRSQQREHYRREVNLPVYVRPAGSDERPVQSRFLDLGGGGASLYNPGGRYRGADDVELTFHPDSDERLSLSARVVRTSHGHSVIHVDFGQLRESVRDRIYRVLFNKTTQQ
jgi:c-di-GMP-binding flagellar brake protein YcgR